VFDVAIIGGGPAALSAAIYTARAGKTTIVFERSAIGGLVAQTNRIENYPGFIGAGIGLTDQMKSQAEASGAKLNYGECSKVEASPDGTCSLTIDSNTTQAKTIIIASGNEPRPLGVPGEDKATISRCATCDAALYKGKIVAVIGGGDSAIQESLHLANLADKVIVISRSAFRASPTLLTRATQDYVNIDLRQNTTLNEIARMDTNSQILNITHPDGRGEFLQVQGIFAYIGYNPASRFLQDSGVTLDPEGYVVTEPKTHATNLKGIFAAGDIEAGSTKQAITAAAAGAEAAIAAVQHLDAPTQK